MRKNTEKNREGLAEEAASNMDLGAMEEYIRDQFEEYYKTLTHKEFNEAWKQIFGE